MSIHTGRRLQCAAACGLVVAYAGLSHYCNSTGARNLGAALALAPLCIATIVAAWRGAPSWAFAPTSLGMAAGLYWVWPFLERHFSMVSLVQESSIYGLLGYSFGRSLESRRVALCTRMADKVHGPLSPREVVYTRRVTLAWAVFFWAIAATSVALYATAPLRLWSLYVNFCVLPLVGCMFLGEYLVRRRVLPEVTRAGLAATVRVYFASDP